MSRTPDSATQCPKHNEQPTYEEQALEDQLTQEQFDNELEKDLEVMLTQKQCDKEEGEQKEEAAEGEEEEWSQKEANGGRFGQGFWPEWGDREKALACKFC